MPDEPVPVRRAVVGCLLLAIVGLGLAALVRPLIFSVAPARDDSVVIVAQAAELNDGPIRRDVLLGASYGWDGEIDAGDGNAQMALILAPALGGGAVASAGASPVADDCPVEIGADRLRDCDGRAWTFEGLPIDPGLPPLQRFPVVVDDGAVIVDMTRTLDE
jgi:hypothetical protein